ncbi:MAG: hypothetical protein HY347_10805, partial [candidate division NC10 bacterium]|nr:hypothetical protein [candidate division NC10 bacterium]
MQRFQDTRRAPQIPTPVIVMGLIAGAALGIERLRQVDRFLRQPAARRRLGRSRPRVASDSTVVRVVGTLEEPSVRAGLRAMTGGMRGRGAGKLPLPDRGPTPVGVVEGSSVGKLLARVFVQVGELELPEDLEPWEKPGTELLASYRLLRRVGAHRGQGWIERLVSDGLSRTREFFRFCREERGCHGVVKPDEETLTLREDADGLFDAQPCLPGVEDVEGVDAQRAGAYRIWTASGFAWEGVPSPLRV